MEKTSIKRKESHFEQLINELGIERALELTSQMTEGLRPKEKDSSWLQQTLDKASPALLVLFVSAMVATIIQINATRYSNLDGEKEEEARISADEKILKRLDYEIKRIDERAQAFLLELARMSEREKTRDVILYGIKDMVISNGAKMDMIHEQLEANK